VRLAVVVITMGTRPDELARCLGSVRAQDGGPYEISVVGNGCELPALDGAVVTSLAENIGAPGGRNAGIARTTAELVLFLDDDAWLPAPDVLARVADRFAADPSLGALQLRVTDPDGTSLRRWVPRARVGDPTRPGPAFALAEGATVVRRAAFDAVGGWEPRYFFAHEGVELAWRLWDAGWTVGYAGDIAIRHPATEAHRHAIFYRNNARNRVWLARRNLPLPIAALYLLDWLLVTVLRLLRDPSALREWSRGFVAGWRSDAGPRRPMRWATVVRLARLGQPPII
jgi:GT2 family glycosyltransferase